MPTTRRDVVGRCLGAVLAAVLLAACTSGPGGSPSTAEPSGVPALRVDVVAGGLDHPWDVAQAPDGTLLVDERSGGFTAVRPDGSARPVAADLGDLFAEGETGLMGLTLDPAFATNRRFYTCQGVQEAAGPEIQVIAWTVDDG